MTHKKLIVLALATIFGSGTATAADLGTLAPSDPIPPEAPLFTWSGAYVGGLIGYGWGDKFAVDIEEPDEFADYDLHGWGGGIEIGYNWQSGNYVFGLEADILFTGIDGDGLVDDEDPIETEVNHLATVTGRLGMAFDRTLLYLEAGGAYAHEEHTYFYDFDEDEGLSATSSDDRFGALVGGGLEYAFDNNWIMKVEYNYMHFGDEDIGFNTEGEQGEDDDLNIDQDMHTVKLGLKYKF